MENLVSNPSTPGRSTSQVGVDAGLPPTSIDVAGKVGTRLGKRQRPGGEPSHVTVEVLNGATAETKRRRVELSVKPVPGMDDRFPLTNPDPVHAGEPHPDYADVSGRGIAANVKILDVQLTDDGKEKLLELAARDREQGKKGGRRLDASVKKLKNLFPKLGQSVSRELQRTIEGKPRSAEIFNIRDVEKGDVPDFEKKLVGQKGLFVNQGSGKIPTVSRGEVLSLFGGALIRNDRELAQQILASGGEYEFSRYALELGQSVREGDKHLYAKQEDADFPVISPHGAASPAAFINTATQSTRKRPGKKRRARAISYDDRRINSIFLPFRVELLDRNGAKKVEYVAAIGALDNLKDQILLDYGPYYLRNLSSTRSVGHDSTEEVNPASVNQALRHMNTNATSSRYDLRDRNRDAGR